MKVIFALLSIFISVNSFAKLDQLSTDELLAKKLVSKVYLGHQAFEQDEFNELSTVQDYIDSIRYDYPFVDSVVFKHSLDLSLALSIAHLINIKKQDKVKHALVGAIIGYGVTKLCGYITRQNDSLLCSLTGAAASIIIGILKELYDSTGRGTVDYKDAIYTFVPGTLISFRIMF